MRFFLSVQGNAIAFHPGVRFHPLSRFANANAQISGNFLARQEPTKRERFFEASRMANIVPHGRSHHARGQFSCSRERGLGLLACAG